MMSFKEQDASISPPAAEATKEETSAKSLHRLRSMTQEPVFRRFQFFLPQHVPVLDLELIEPTEAFTEIHPVLRQVYARHHAARASTLYPLQVDIEYSIHSCPSRIFRECRLIFPELFRSPQSTLDGFALAKEGWETQAAARLKVAAASIGQLSTTQDIQDNLNVRTVHDEEDTKTPFISTWNPTNVPTGKGDSIQRSDMLILPTFQPCQFDLVGMGPEQEREKNEKLEWFYLWAITLCMSLRNQGYWADLTDPASGYPVLGERGPSFYPDVPGMQILLKYDVMNTGCCSVLLHPRWGSHVYPATVFTTAPQELVSACLNRMQSTSLQ